MKHFWHRFLTELYDHGPVSIAANIRFSTDNSSTGWLSWLFRKWLVYQLNRGVMCHVNNTEVTGLENLSSHSTCIKANWAFLLSACSFLDCSVLLAPSMWTDPHQMWFLQSTTAYFFTPAINLLATFNWKRLDYCFSFKAFISF